MKNNPEINCEATYLASNHEILSSIRAYGLLNPHKISQDILSNQTVQSGFVNEHICVNYVNLKEASVEEKKIAYIAAFDEEYLGVSGISLERTHPLQKISNPELCHLEIQQRIMHQVVFILNPPKLLPFKKKPAGAQFSTDLAFYSEKLDDGFSQTREKNMFTNQNTPDCIRVTEIKTARAFNSKDIIAILAPEFLYEMCRSIFSDVEIISVNSCQKTLKCLPNMLKMYFDEYLPAPLSLNVPDYARALDGFCDAQKLTQFSLHAVRLNTPLDFNLRPIINWREHVAFLSSIKAQMAHEYNDTLAWFWIHKQYSVSKELMITNLKKNGLPDIYLSNVIKSNKASIQKFNQLVSLKGNGCTNIIYNPLHAGQIHELLKNGVALIHTPNFFMTYCPKEKTPLLKQVVENFKTIEEDAATKIQAQFRRYHCQKFFKRYQKAKQEMELNKSILLSMRQK